MGLLHFLVKYSLFLLNLIFTVLGIAIVTVGVLIHLKYFDEVPNSEELKAALQIISILLIAFGVIVFVIAFAGCCGAVTETKCLLVTYAVFMVFLITAKIYLAVVWNQNVNTFRDRVDKFINNTFDEPARNVTFHMMEAAFHCCGTAGPGSYEVLPPTCCPIEGTINTESECLLENAFNGCLELIDNLITGIANTVKTVFISVIVFEGLEFIGTIYLCSSINKSKPKYYH